MLVTFSCEVCPNITMFGDVAVRMLKIMGHSGTVPSAFAPDEVGPALERLEAAAEADRKSPTPEEQAAGRDDEPPVRFSVRAEPLIDLLRIAAEAKCEVMWDRNS